MNRKNRNLAAVLLLLLCCGCTSLASAEDSPRATIDCEVIGSAEQPDLWYVHILTTEYSGKHVHRVEDQPFKKREKALKECNRIVAQWENLYAPKKKKK